jgi:hypothetical protein
MPPPNPLLPFYTIFIEDMSKKPSQILRRDDWSVSFTFGGGIFSNFMDS